MNFDYSRGRKNLTFPLDVPRCVSNHDAIVSPLKLGPKDLVFYAGQSLLQCVYKTRAISYCNLDHKNKVIIRDCCLQCLGGEEAVAKMRDANVPFNPTSSKNPESNMPAHLRTHSDLTIFEDGFYSGLSNGSWCNFGDFKKFVEKKE